MDVGLKPEKFSVFLVVAQRVSILVLMDVGLKLPKIEVIFYRKFEFQSLF